MGHIMDGGTPGSQLWLKRVSTQHSAWTRGLDQTNLLVKPTPQPFLQLPLSSLDHLLTQFTQPYLHDSG